MVLALSTLSDDVLYLYQVLSKYLIRYSVTDLNSGVDARGWSQFTMGHNSVKTVDGVMVHNLPILSDDALYLYRVLRKYLQGFQSY